MSAAVLAGCLSPHTYFLFRAFWYLPQKSLPFFFHRLHLATPWSTSLGFGFFSRTLSTTYFSLMTVGPPVFAIVIYYLFEIEQNNVGIESTPYLKRAVDFLFRFGLQPLLVMFVCIIVSCIDLFMDLFMAIIEYMGTFISKDVAPLAFFLGPSVLGGRRFLFGTYKRRHIAFAGTFSACFRKRTNTINI